MASITSPNMSLVIPTAGTQPGPEYAYNINTSLTLIDQHDHSPGRGVQITPAGLDINSDLSLNSNSLIDALTVVFTASDSASTAPMSLSIAPGGESPPQQDLWYTPDTGVPIQITKNGQVNVIASSIEGETYAAGTFFWTQAQDALPTTPANFDIGSIVLRPNTALTAFGVQLVPPSAISSQYSINLPLLPASQKIMTLDNSGNMAAPYTVDNSTIVIAANVIKVPDAGIGPAQIAATKSLGYDYLAPGFDGVWNVYSTTSSDTFTVPDDVVLLIAEIAGGGGGGGGGGQHGGSPDGGGGGGAGGAGIIPETIIIGVIPGDVLTLMVGAGGTAGTAPSGAGTAGGTGGTTSITGTGVSITVLGGAGGPGGAIGVGGTGLGGTGVASSWAPKKQTAGSGTGGNGLSAGSTAGAAGADSKTAIGGAGGANLVSGSPRGGGGGGGGAGFGAGGAGGASTNGTGNPGVAGGISAGGGGGAGGAGNGGVGAAGGAGLIRFYWLGAAS